jgi:hypothetical protein
VELGATGTPDAASTTSEMDALASALVDTLQSAARAAGRHVRKRTRSAPWWTAACAAAEYRAMGIYPLGFNQEVQSPELSEPSKRVMAGGLRSIRALSSNDTFIVCDILPETKVDSE